MIVHLAGSLRSPDVDLKHLQDIVEVIHNRGGVLAHNWIDAALTRHRDKVHVSNWKPFVDNDLDAIKRADVVIVEATHYSFSQGYVVAAALELNKPVLILSRDAIDGKSVSGITNTLFTYRRYSDSDELQSATNTFLSKNTIHTKDLRFNIFLTRNIFQYLEHTSYETGKNKSEIIREIIKRKTNREQP
jgi:hypothetical protein